MEKDEKIRLCNQSRSSLEVLVPIQHLHILRTIYGPLPLSWLVGVGVGNPSRPPSYSHLYGHRHRIQRQVLVLGVDERSRPFQYAIVVRGRGGCLLKVLGCRQALNYFCDR